MGSRSQGIFRKLQISFVAGAWDRFHVYVNSNLKNYFSIKKRYSMTNLGLVGFNKRFLYATVRAPESTHDNRLLKESSIYTATLDGHIMPKLFDLVISGRFHLLPLVTAPFLNMHGYLKCITRVHSINSKRISTKGYVEHGWLRRMRMGC